MGKFQRVESGAVVLLALASIGATLMTTGFRLIGFVLSLLGILIFAHRFKDDLGRLRFIVVSDEGSHVTHERMSTELLVSFLAIFVSVVVMGYIFFFSGPKEESVTKVAMKKELAVNSPPTLPAPEEQARPKLQPPPRPNNLTPAQVWQIRFASLSLPRPCFVKITAAPENKEFGASFREAFFFEAYVRSFQEDHKGAIEMCKLIQDDKDESPDSYKEELNRMSPGIVINGAGADAAVIKFLVKQVREATNAQLNVRVGTTKPSVDIPDTWIYVQIGAGSLWNER